MVAHPSQCSNCGLTIQKTLSLRTVVSDEEAFGKLAACPAFLDIAAPIITPIAIPIASHAPPDPSATAMAVPIPAPSAMPSPICIDGRFIMQFRFYRPSGICSCCPTYPGLTPLRGWCMLGKPVLTLTKQDPGQFLKSKTSAPILQKPVSAPVQRRLRSNRGWNSRAQSLFLFGRVRAPAPTWFVRLAPDAPSSGFDRPIHTIRATCRSTSAHHSFRPPAAMNPVVSAICHRFLAPSKADRTCSFRKASRTVPGLALPSWSDRR